MNYQQALNFLYDFLPMYQRVGRSALKKDLTNTLALCEALGQPHEQFKSVHVAGTNGKGSSSHMLASIFQEAGYKTGLYTSPHLKSFTERIRVDGTPISEEEVARFVTAHEEMIQRIQPSFFEMTVVMAFDHFARKAVDIAVIEVGMGGRLDSTNVITPEISLITNIGLDHTEFLGDTLDKIAFEKAGIVKPGIPVVIGTTQEETTPVFDQVAKERKAEIIYADTQSHDLNWELDLKGQYQKANLRGVLATVDKMRERGWELTYENLKNGLKNVGANTGLKGRWQRLSDRPLTICDTGHNVEGVRVLVEQMNTLTYDDIFLILGFVNDKKVGEVLQLFPSGAHFIFCQAAIPRAMPLEAVRVQAESLGLHAEYIADVNRALDHARNMAGANDFIFVGGSTFVVAELEEL